VTTPLQHEDETRLGGGGLTVATRVGDTVRRTTGPWTPAVQALLRHLEAARFPGAPRSIGIDGQGREILAWVEGEVSSWYADSDLAAFGRIVRELHDVTEGFAAPRGTSWQRMIGAPDGPVICHNDLSPDNVVRAAGGPVIIDWDLAAPGTRIWDLAWAAYRGVPLYDDATCARLGIPVPDRPARLRLLVDAYGLHAADRASLVATVVARLDCLIATARTWAAQGRKGWVEVWRDTGGRQWRAGLAYVRSERNAWEAALR
jgi:hypothetical protein